ncbi:MAG TPA: type II toxin-antitoxin system HicB family antitoxin [Candidatus Acidoferrum sp.]|nr:type II toxin-antitoxin system HicB family antitoxin [Candidatus Acidoferrum sp.]
MAKVSIREKASQKVTSRDYNFTVVFEPVKPGYQVTVPLLPGLITYGRTLAEAREMARDAILCHLEGLRKDGERVPDEKSTIQEKVRVALSA